MRILTVPILFLLVLIPSQPLVAQQDPERNPAQNTGQHPFGSFTGSGIDNVTLSNGNLQISIPILSLPGRGMDMGLVLNYNSKFWVAKPTLNGGSIYASIDRYQMGNPGLGWSIGIPGSGFFTWRREFIGTSGWLGWGTYLDATGTNHSFYNSDTTYLQGMVIPSAFLAQNSSDIVVNQVGGGLPYTPPNHPPATIHFKDGKKFHSSGGISDGTLNVYHTPGTLKDSNGNFITITRSSPSTTYRDTLGRTVTYTHATRTPSTINDTLSYLDSSGTPRTITFTLARGRPQCPPPFGTTYGCVVPTDHYFLTDITFPAIGKSAALKYHFDYHPTGELQKVVLPGGGYIRYEYNSVYFSAEAGEYKGDLRSLNGRGVSLRAVSPAGATEQLWTYIPDAAGVEITATDPVGNKRISTFSSDYETERILKDSSNNTLRKFTKSYVGQIFTFPREGYGSYNARLASETTRLVDSHPIEANQLTSKVEYDYDSTNGNLKAQRDFHYGVGTPGALARTTLYDYLHELTGSEQYINRRILDRVKTRTLRDPGGVAKAFTQYNYDQYVQYPLNAGPTFASGHDPAYDAAYFWRGNVTETIQYENAAVPSGALLTIHHYDTAGNVVLVTDPRSFNTTYTYSATTQFAYPDLITNPLLHLVTRNYFFSTGLLQSETDPNSRTTTYTYDLLNRIREIRRPDCTGTCPNSIEYIYNDAAASLSVEERTRLNNVPLIRALSTHYDGLGRAKKRETSDPEGLAVVETQYDSVGRVSLISNPYRPGTPLWTTTLYDGLSRVRTVTTPDGAAATSLYVGNRLTVTDQAGKVRRSVIDALGRIVRVDEPINALGDLDDGAGNPAQPTCYAYDELNNLRQVIQGPWNAATSTCQGGQSRTFEYDSLSRLTSGTNPEQVDGGGVQIATSFTYDENGNLQTRTDARGITLTYGYDPLNRLTSKTCSPATEICTLTPAASYGYDATGIPNSRGRLTSSQSGTAAWTAQDYDVRGRLKKETNTLESVEFVTEYEYDLAGNSTKMIYPSGKEVRSEYSTANRVGAVKNEMNRNYLTQITYSPHGGLTGGQYGNNLNGSIVYNPRLQPERYQVTGAATVMDLTYNFVLGGNNGNVYRVDDAVGDKFYTYSYDPLNRVGSALGTAQPAQTFYYDRFGNLRKNNPDVAGWVNANTNRLVSYSFDLAGNQLTDDTYTYKYDAENRVVQVNAGAIAEYKYNAAGRRVVKVAANRRTFFIHSQADALLSEYDAPATGPLMTTPERVSPGFGQTTYQHPDHLGSPRMLTTQDQTVLERRDHSPFGEEITFTLNNQIKFTGKMRDSESGLDYFGARYCSSLFGRFMSPDRMSNDWDSENPQSWNLYAYVRNNPLKYIDERGEEIKLVYVRGQGQPFGHTLIKYTDDQNKSILYYEVNTDKNNPDKGEYLVNEYTEKEFKARYGGREPEEVSVEVPHQIAAVEYAANLVGTQWDFHRTKNNCVKFCNQVVEAGGGKIPSDGSMGENPRRYPRDARDGLRKQMEEKKKKAPEEEKERKKRRSKKTGKTGIPDGVEATTAQQAWPGPAW